MKYFKNKWGKMREININDIDKIKNTFIIDIREDKELLETGTMKGAV